MHKSSYIKCLILLVVVHVVINPCNARQIQTDQLFRNQILLSINLKGFQNDFYTHIESMPNLRKYFIDDGVRIEKDLRDGLNRYNSNPLWFLNQLKEGQKSIVIGSFSKTKDLNQLGSYSADTANTFSWFRRIDILKNRLASTDRISYGVLYLSEEEAIGSQERYSNNVEKFDAMIEYLVKSLIQVGHYENVNIILVTESSKPNNSVFFARGPAFKKNFIVGEELQIEKAEIYSLMCFLLDLNPTLFNNTMHDIQVTIESNFQVRAFGQNKYFHMNSEDNDTEIIEQSSYFNKLYYRIGIQKLKSHIDQNEVYVLLLLIILIFFIIVVQFNTYGYSPIRNDKL